MRTRILGVVLLLGLLICVLQPQTRSIASLLPPDLAEEARTLLSDADWGAVDAQGATAAELDVLDVTAADGALVVCLRLSIDDLAEDGWMGMERMQDAVRRRLATLEWQQLSVQAWDEATGSCRPLSDFAPYPTTQEEPLRSLALPESSVTPAAVYETAAAGSLAGKTVYLSAGHGWFWNGSQWRTQRPPYQGLIEDHNNAEVVTQFLIPYLENAGATVIPVRERDWNAARVIGDNDHGSPTYTETGTWQEGSRGTGYDGGTYRYTLATQGEATATATWTVDVPASGEYAVYAWVYPGPNRVPDAHYTVHHAGGSTEVILDQRIHPVTWRYLGTFPFYAGSASITLDNRTTQGGTLAVLADAIRVGGGTFNSLSGLSVLAPATTYASTTPPSAAPQKPWWETSTFYWSQLMGLDPQAWSTFNDVVGRPIYARWHQRTTDADGVYVSWHTNGSRGTARGTVSYVHNNDTYPRTPGSTELQAAVHDELVHDIRVGWDPAWTDRGKGQLNLGELRLLWDTDFAYARIPGVLLEIAFHDNYEDALALKEPEFNRLAARAVYQGIVRYFENRDGVDLVLAPEPPTHLHVRNVGGGALRVGWRPSPVDSIGLRGDAATAYHVYTSPDGFAWGDPLLVSGTEVTLAGLEAGQTRYVRVTGVNAGGESLPTETLGARVGESARALIVNGFDRISRHGLVTEVDPVEGENLRMWMDQINSRSYVVHHGEAIPSAYAWDSASNEAVADGHVMLTDYEILDWILGEESTDVDHTLNSTERALITAYLARDRSLLISGADLGWDLGAKATDRAFLNEQLRVNYVADNAGTYTARTTDGALSGIGDVHFNAPGEYNANSPDVLTPLSGAHTVLTYVGGANHGQGAAIAFADGCRRVLSLGLPIETIRLGERATLVAKAFSFLDACGTIETTIVAPENGRYYNVTPALRGTAQGVDLTAVQLQLQRSDGAYWTTSGWTEDNEWFSANGTEDWFYFMPLSEGSYSLSAQAVGARTDDSPATAAFGIDIKAPLAPTVITPTAGVLITGPVVSLLWREPADLGSPLSYDIAVDNTVINGVKVTPYLGSFRRGSHLWRVRTVDAAGNASPWTSWHAFEVFVEEAFLPLVLRRD
ncbi:MAG: N-acetylmuramoyl-L-alanine amidase [Anaerolineae bacterium]